MNEIVSKAKKAKDSSIIIGSLPHEERNNAILAMADTLIEQREFIIDANKNDIKNGEEAGLSKTILDRLMLNKSRIINIAEGLKYIIKLDDPIGGIISSWERTNGLKINKVSVPLGVIGMIYEARPNVTVDAVGLAIKTGNAVVLRGSSSALHSNRAIVEVISNALKSTTVPISAVQLIEHADHKTVEQLFRLNKYLDVLIPRGGKKLIQYVIENSSVPVLETGAGNCHVYIDRDANLEMAVQITLNSKTDRPSVCNAAETLLVDKHWADLHLTTLVKELEQKDVTCRGCKSTLKLMPHLNQANEEDWSTEYLDYTIAVKIVKNLQEAIDHINKYSTKHSEVIVTNNDNNAEFFLKAIDAAAVYHNASTRFTDGFEFGFGAEIGISTQKLHARGPMGLQALTSYKYKIYGNGQIR